MTIDNLGGFKFGIVGNFCCGLLENFCLEFWNEAVSLENLVGSYTYGGKELPLAAF